MTSPAAVWSIVHEERRALVRDLAHLDAEQWRTPSLCPGWDVHDVLAHLVDTARTTRLRFLRRMVLARFDFDRDNAAGVTRERRQDAAGTLAALAAVADRTTTPPAPSATRLVEAFVHGEDIRRPLSLVRDYPPGPVVTALRYQVGASVSMGGGRQRAEGLHLVATDAPFAHGRGPQVRGSAMLLLLAVSGRPVDADQFTGPGATTFSQRIGT